MLTGMKNQAANTVIDVKTVIGTGVGAGGGVIAITEVSQLALTVVSIFVGVATFVYMCMGIINRRQEYKLMKKKEDSQF